MMQTPKNKILKLIQSRGRGWSFSGIDFINKFRRWEIDQAFAGLYNEGKVRRIMQGLYDYPLYSEVLKREVAPDIQKVAEAIARKYNWRIYPDGDTSLNYLGLSNQVVAKNIYLSDGKTKEFVVGNRVLLFKHKSTKELVVKNHNTALVIQAIKAIGEKQITDEFLQKLSDKFSLNDWQKIKSDAVKTTGWVYQIITNMVENLERKVNG